MPMPIFPATILMGVTFDIRSLKTIVSIVRPEVRKTYQLGKAGPFLLPGIF